MLLLLPAFFIGASVSRSFHSGGAFGQNFGDESMDFVYLDALHSYRDAMNDIIAWYPKVLLAPGR